MDAEPRTLAGKRLLELDYRMVEWWSMTGPTFSLVQVVKRSEALALIEEAEARADTGLDALRARNEELEAALADMVNQFAYWSDGENPGQITGGLSALEGAFAALGYKEPHRADHLRCDEPGCRDQASMGWPTRPGGTGLNGGYRRTCWDHSDIGKARAAARLGEGRE